MPGSTLLNGIAVADDGFADALVQAVYVPKVLCAGGVDVGQVVVVVVRGQLIADLVQHALAHRWDVHQVAYGVVLLLVSLRRDGLGLPLT